MKKCLIVIFCILPISIWATDDPSNEHIRKALELIRMGSEVSIGDERIYCKSMLPEFYQRNDFQLVWTARFRKEFLNVLSKVSEDGLSSDDYHFQILSEMDKSSKSPEQKAELDLMLTDAFLLYASHFLNGKINPETVDSEWKAMRREGNARAFLEQTIENGEITAALKSLKPSHAGYDALKSQLKKFLSIKDSGGWTQISEGPTLKTGMTDSVRIPQLINRLMITGDLNPDEHPSYTLDIYLEQALRQYQKRNGLEVDGALGKQTIESLNIPIEIRIEQILVNLERYRWISQDLGKHYIIVNIADFQMQVFQNGALTYEENVIVGKTYRKTPVFSSKMTYIVLNPYWVVPPTILFQDFLPEIQKNPSFLVSKNIKVLKGFGTDAQIIDPSTVDWTLYSKNNFPFTLRQDPGPTNALGAVKFIFPNTYNVYIHDTPSKEMFLRTDRAFSSGCIRLKNPLNFAYYLAKNNPGWSKESIDKVLKEGKEHTLLLKNPLNVHILYLTCWVDNGQIHFRKDIYNRDKPVIKALREKANSI